MTERKTVYAQLKKLGYKVKLWGAAEVDELPAILMPGEEIKVLLRGRYENGFATLVATNERLLLVDKKLLHLMIEDVRYDMVAEVDFMARVVDATVRINTLNKILHFTSFRIQSLRELTNYVQQRVLELRQQQYHWQEFEQQQGAYNPLRSIKDTLAPQQRTATSATPGSMAMVNPSVAGLGRPISRNNFTKIALTTKHNFLPKVPRRFRPDGG